MAKKAKRRCFCVYKSLRSGDWSKQMCFKTKSAARRAARSIVDSKVALAPCGKKRARVSDQAMSYRAPLRKGVPVL